MSTKCTVLVDDGKDRENVWYHFYYDYADNKYHFEYLDKESFNECINRIGKILEGCPFSDSGIYCVDIKNNKARKMKQKLKCYLLDKAKKELKKDNKKTQKEVSQENLKLIYNNGKSLTRDKI